jgi:hypothetical protein
VFSNTATCESEKSLALRIKQTHLYLVSDSAGIQPIFCVVEASNAAETIYHTFTQTQRISDGVYCSYLPYTVFVGMCKAITSRSVETGDDRTTYRENREVKDIVKKRERMRKGGREREEGKLKGNNTETRKKKRNTENKKKTERQVQR